jgi:hypothetical protein
MEILDFLYATGEKYTIKQFIQKEINILNHSVHILSDFVTPSEACNYLLSSLEVNPDEKMLQFINNLCLHEMWKSGKNLSSFALTYSAVLVYYEQMNHLPMIKRLVTMVHDDWEDDFRELYPEISELRSRIIDSARFLTSDNQCIARFNDMLQYSLREIMFYVFEASFECAHTNAGNPAKLQEDANMV